MNTLGRIPKAVLRLAGIAVLTLLAVPSYGAGRAPETATLTVQIGNVVPQGTIRLGLYTEASYPDNDAEPVASADVPARGGETVIELQNIPPGTYAIETYQDLNNNGKMDTTWIGIPKEPYGFSRDARPRLSKPRFESVAFVVSAGQNNQSLHLQNTNAMVAAQ